MSELDAIEMPIIDAILKIGSKSPRICLENILHSLLSQGAENIKYNLHFLDIEFSLLTEAFCISSIKLLSLILNKVDNGLPSKGNSNAKSVINPAQFTSTKSTLKALTL